MVCLILLAIQLVRVSFLQNTKDQKPSLAETLISDEKDVICEGTVYRIENKSQSTAIYLKDAVVSCTDQKSKNQTIKEKKILITIKNSKSGKRIRMKILIPRGISKVLKSMTLITRSAETSRQYNIEVIVIP